MMIDLPYGRGYIKYDFPDEKLRAVLSVNNQTHIDRPAQSDIVRKALDEPECSKRLSELVMEADKILIITSDHTRPVPSRITMPILLEQIRSSNLGADIRILIATGFHRPSTLEEMKEKFGEEIVENEIILNHDSRDEKSIISLGTLPSGGELQLNSLIGWADITIAEGFIEPHFRRKEEHTSRYRFSKNCFW
jgi:lactate racemase